MAARAALNGPGILEALPLARSGQACKHLGMVDQADRIQSMLLGAPLREICQRALIRGLILVHEDLDDVPISHELGGDQAR